MARTESKSFQVHPNDEQAEINSMQKFHWNLLNSQEIKTVDNHQERRGDSIYSITNTEHYVKLTFSRDLDTPNLAEIKKLEDQYTSLPRVEEPKIFPFVPWWVWGIATLFYGIGAIAWVAYYFLLYTPKKKAADILSGQNDQKRGEVMQALSAYG